ncbi:type II toxin-antitoxin system RatA family toxin [Endozoicomonas euniceicola]|uniref:Type II toxin-antitoxin system RatA family toxin n=1 Tax=Endozoicomonas euniceicola TaxID=1234143 RepID=A0ABY6GN66_9GAMM|nr:type II toxin-antitoxin system RatA family toxin [Endozoicomonas euniceicola]UYM14174.1 type II toxin-antitoxin system RatA family toxin [Endozoicomonas euniceicola]
MAKVSRSALILHPAEKVYDLVADVESYPKFLPWCQDALVLFSEGASSEGASSEGVSSEGASSEGVSSEEASSEEASSEEASSEEASSEVDVVEALLVIAKGGLRCEFATRNLMRRNQSIDMQLLRGPFSHLQGVWRFKPLGDDCCSIFMELDFELSNPVLKAALGSVFGQAMNKMVAAFCQRADQLYGTGSE